MFGLRSFEEMTQALDQWRQGLLTEAEVILALQCDVFGTNALRQILSLPPKVLMKTVIQDWDESVSHNRAKGYLASERGVENSLSCYLIGKVDDLDNQVVLCGQDMFAVVEKVFNSVESQGSIYLNAAGLIQTSGTFSKKGDADKISLLLSGGE